MTEQKPFRPPVRTEPQKIGGLFNEVVAPVVNLAGAFLLLAAAPFAIGYVIYKNMNEEPEPNPVKHRGIP